MTSSSLYAGVARADITPPSDCMLAGFAGREHGADGIHDPLTATALALSTGDTPVVILALDLIGISMFHIVYLHDHIRERYGLTPDRLIINCSHTHAGPMIELHRYNLTLTDGTPLEGDAGYLDSLKNTCARVISEALESLVPAHARWGLGETQIGISRRAPDTAVYDGPPSGHLGFYANYPNPGMTIDRSCPVLLISDADDAPYALLFSAPCHPTTMSYDNYLVSAEYPGVTRRILEETMDGAPALFIQGIGGDVKPRIVAKETSFRSGNYNDVEAVGTELAEDVLSIMATGLESIDLSLKTALEDVPVPLKDGWGIEKLRELMEPSQPEHRRTWAQWWLDNIAEGMKPPTSLPVMLSILEISPGIRFAGVSGELLTGMGLKIRKHIGNGLTFPLGYTNGVVAYIPDSDVIREGGYEAVESLFFHHDIPAPWREDIDKIFYEAFDRLMEKCS